MPYICCPPILSTASNANVWMAIVSLPSGQSTFPLLRKKREGLFDSFETGNSAALLSEPSEPAVFLQPSVADRIASALTPSTAGVNILLC